MSKSPISYSYGSMVFADQMAKSMREYQRELQAEVERMASYTSTASDPDVFSGQEMARVYAAKNGYFARTASGSVVVGATPSDLFTALQGILAEEALRRQTLTKEQEKERELQNEREQQIAVLKKQILAGVIPPFQVNLDNQLDEEAPPQSWNQKALQHFK